MSDTKLSKRGQFFDYSTLIIVLVLTAFGLVMVYSTSSFSALKNNLDSAHYFKKQLFATVLGIGCMTVASFIDYKKWKDLSPIIYFAALLTIFLVIPFGKELNGAKRWIYIGKLSFQPAEFVKLALIILLAAFATYSGKYMAKLKNSIYFILAGGVPAVLILVITRNLSTAVILAGITYLMLIISNPRPKWIYVLSVIGVIGIIVFLVLFFKSVESGTGLGFRFRRLLAWRDPVNYHSQEGYQTLQALYAIGSGGFFGKGLGQSVQKMGFIPEAQNDMIFSVICEELGLFGGICLIVLFILLIYRMMVIANNAPDLFGSLIVSGVMVHIAIQVILNIAVVTNMLPNTGVSLPFISYGGTSVMFLMAEMGLVLNVSRQIRVPVTDAPKRKDGNR